MYNYHNLSSGSLNELLHRKEVSIYRLKQKSWLSMDDKDQIDVLARHCVLIIAVLAARAGTLPLWDDWKWK